MKIDLNNILISKELKEFLIPLSAEELSLLEASIVSEGCREPLIVWNNKKKPVLIDGHNRYAICQKNGLPFKVKSLEFQGVEEVKIWMINNQIGRRNLNPDQLSFYRGLKYLNLKKNKGGQDNVRSKGQNELSTSEVLAEQFNVSASTVKRDAKFAEGLQIIARSNESLKKKILLGEVSVKKADVQLLSQASNKEKITIKNEADLYNKAKAIKEDLMDQIEHSVNEIQKSKIEKAVQVLQEKEPVFLNKPDRLSTIKGKIISAINKAIRDKDHNAINELKKLIDLLEDAIFD